MRWATNLVLYHAMAIEPIAAMAAIVTTMCGAVRAYSPQ